MLNRAKYSPKLIVIKDTASENDARGKGQILEMSVSDDGIKFTRENWAPDNNLDSLQSSSSLNKARIVVTAILGMRH